VANTEDNLEKLEEFLENDLAKKLLQAFRNETGNPSIKTILEKELAAKDPLRVLNDQAEDN
jgi:Mn-dependent DtxR family transcriptional regulator